MVLDAAETILGFLDLIGLFIVVIPEIRKEEGNGMMPKDASQ